MKKVFILVRRSAGNVVDFGGAKVVISSDISKSQFRKVKHRTLLSKEKFLKTSN